ncbi:hypothetical protein RB195_012459 [Necator americanus]|uniref:Uncharacterized protein n=1 Tax=Necator americanus TaxID=51031 RepID=A0ABR1D765_NECAM
MNHGAVAQAAELEAYLAIASEELRRFCGAVKRCHFKGKKRNMYVALAFHCFFAFHRSQEEYENLKKDVSERF